MHFAVVPVLGIIFNVFLTCVAANLTLGFKVTKISANNKPANCNVANTTYAHGETFKLDCKTQCVCENGRHACSSLCPKEQLPAPEDTISCRSPRLVEVPGHCCKMWLCENPTADVYATCHNSSTSPWTPCSRICGLGISTRFTTTTAGCNQLSNLRLCENRKCDNIDGDNAEEQEDVDGVTERGVAEKENQKYLIKSKQMKNKLRRQHEQQHHKHDKHRQEHGEHTEHEHRIRKGHECRSIQRLGPARIRLGECVSKKLYRPKICGRCHYNTKCCVPSLSTTIQVELLCPLNAIDPISFVQQQLTTRQRQPQQQQQQHQPYYAASSLTSLWDTHSLDAIDQEYLQSHQIQIANKFIAVEWILKCECTKKDNCQRIVNTTMSSSSSSSSSSNRNSNENDHENNENLNNKNVQNYNYFKLNYKQQQQQHHTRQQHINNTPHNDKDDDDNENENDNANDNDDDEADNDSDTNINNINSHKKQTKDYYATYTNKNNYNYNKNNIRNYKELDEQEANKEEEMETTSSSLSSSYGGDVATTSDEIQPDIIPYPPPPFSANKQTHNQNNNSNNNSGNKKNKQTAKKINEKFKLEHNKQQQQYYEQWLLQQYQPYQQEQEKEEQRPETLAT